MNMLKKFIVSTVEESQAPERELKQALGILKIYGVIGLVVYLFIEHRERRSAELELEKRMLELEELLSDQLAKAKMEQTAAKQLKEAQELVDKFERAKGIVERAKGNGSSVSIDA